MKILLIGLLLTFGLVADSAQLIPLGDWPLCKLGIQMPDCAFAHVGAYTVSGTGDWILTAVFADGTRTVQHVKGGTVLELGGIVEHYTLVPGTAERMPRR